MVKKPATKSKKGGSGRKSRKSEPAVVADEAMGTGSEGGTARGEGLAEGKDSLIADLQRKLEAAEERERLLRKELESFKSKSAT